jgi:ribosomal protein L17
MGSLFVKAGIEVTTDNKREIDQIIHKIVGVPYKNCSATWREVKKRLAGDDGDFIQELKKELATKKFPEPT